MKNNLITYLPAAGHASRLGGIPKFYLPISSEKSLIGYHIEELKKNNIYQIIIGANKYFNKSIEELYPETEVKIINSKSMVDTVIQSGLSNNKNSLVVMPDTYFDNYEIVEKMSDVLLETSAEVVLGLWQIREDQKGKLGQCEVDESFVLKVIDKEIDCQENFFWGLVMWKPAFNNFIKKTDSHFGISLNRALAQEIKIRYVVADGDYFDCGTFEEYKILINNQDK